MFKKKDLILAGSVLVIALIATLFIILTKEEGAKVVITVDGEVYQTLPLDENTTVIIGDQSGDYNVIEIKDGYVTMTEADCPDKLCVSHSEIHYNHESIVCLPHKVVVEITDGEQSDLDVIAQ